MASLILDQADIDRIEEIRQQFDPASHLVAADALEGLNSQEREAALVFMRELIRDELYGSLIFRTALKAAAAYRVAVSEDTAYQRFNDDWDNRYLKDRNGQGRGLRVSHWGHNLGFIRGDWWVFLNSVRAEYRWPLQSACWTLMDLAVTAMFARTQAGINRQTLESQRRLAQQARAHAAYEDMLHMVGWVMELVNATKPILEEAGAKPPQEPDMERVRSSQAGIGVHGSPEVKAILEKWAARRQEFFAAAWLLDSMQGDEKRGIDIDKSYGQPNVEQWKEVEDIRKELHEMVRELEGRGQRGDARLTQDENLNSNHAAPSFRFLRNFRRSRSLVPPQIPKASRFSTAYSRRWSRTGQPAHMARAAFEDPPRSGKNIASACLPGARRTQPRSASRSVVTGA